MTNALAALALYDAMKRRTRKEPDDRIIEPAALRAACRGRSKAASP